MEFGWTDQQRKFRESLRAFIAREVPKNYFTDMLHDGWSTPERVELSKDYCAKLAAENMLVREWPKEYGGGGDGDWWNYFIQSEESFAAGEPRGPQYMNTSWIGPAIIRYGSDAQKKEHLTRILGGRVIWCQGFSEPHGGSDLGAMRTAAVRTDDGYVINGSKIWTSYAPFADYIFLLARTGQERKNISSFLLSMKTPGIRVRENKGLVQSGHLNEVFFTDVRVPESSRLGAEGTAWDVMRNILNYERVGVPMYHLSRMALDRSVEKLQSEGRFSSPSVRAHAGRVVSAVEAARQITYAVMDERAKNRPPTAFTNVARALNVRCVKLTADFIAQHIGPDGDGQIEDFFRVSLSNGHGGGAAEIVLNTIATQFLHLPRE
jgi:alkylation response protein AidB-like acyl-CoA dehydrogenase